MVLELEVLVVVAVLVQVVQEIHRQYPHHKEIQVALAH
tara:strand:+ start:159 stop:272 length:114 start_codon:yes stop_codon:yes gene_type:complete